MDSCFDLVGSRQHGVASYEIFSWSADIHILTKMVMTSDETQIQILVNRPMSHAKRVPRDNWKNPDYHVVSAFHVVSALHYFWQIRSFTDPVFIGSIFVCRPLHHHVLP